MTPDTNAPPTHVPSHRVSYPQFLWRMLAMATDGTLPFYAWMTLLTALALVGANAWADQVVHGMELTGMTDHVSWGLYIANFTFGVGLAAGGVLMVVPAYLYRDQKMRDVVIYGEIVAIAAIIVSLLFVVVDLGRPDRFWHLIPGIGRFNWPMSMLTWDVIVLNGYLLINLHIVGYLLYTRFRGQTPDKRWYRPFVYLSIVWAISIHTVTAFLYAGLGGRHFWNTALLAPRFLASAFVSGPAFIILILLLARRVAGAGFSDRPIQTLVQIIRITALLNLFMLGSELFTVLYAGGSHRASLDYLFFGLHGHNALVPWIWSAVLLNITAVALFLSPRALERQGWLAVACVFAFSGVWIEKGMGLIIPGFIPSTLHEIVEYFPTITEWKITVGIWAVGLAVVTLGVKLALPVLTGAVRCVSAPAEPGSDEPGPVGDSPATAETADSGRTNDTTTGIDGSPEDQTAPAPNT